MGVKTPIALEAAQRLFPEAGFRALHATNEGIIDTTYIADTARGRCILKRYEAAAPEAVEREARLLRRRARNGG